MAESINSDLLQEIDVLQHIYLDELVIHNDERGHPIAVTIQLSPSTGECDDQKWVCLTLHIELTSRYPAEIPVINIRSPRGLTEEHVNSLKERLLSIAEEHCGGAMLYDVIEYARESLTTGNVPCGPCTICLEDLTSDIAQPFTRTICYHYFHCLCLRHYIDHCHDEFRRQKAERKTNQPSGPVDATAKPFQAMCPVCREPLPDDLVDDLNLLHCSPPFVDPGVFRYVPTEEMVVLQHKMAERYRRQLEKGGIIDLEAEKNKFLVPKEGLLISLERPQSSAGADGIAAATTTQTAVVESGRGGNKHWQHRRRNPRTDGNRQNFRTPRGEPRRNVADNEEFRPRDLAGDQQTLENSEQGFDQKLEEVQGSKVTRHNVAPFRQDRSRGWWPDRRQGPPRQQRPSERSEPYQDHMDEATGRSNWSQRSSRVNRTAENNNYAPHEKQNADGDTTGEYERRSQSHADDDGCGTQSGHVNGANSEEKPNDAECRARASLSRNEPHRRSQQGRFRNRQTNATRNRQASKPAAENPGEDVVGDIDSLRTGGTGNKMTPSKPKDTRLIDGNSVVDAGKIESVEETLLDTDRAPLGEVPHRKHRRPRRRHSNRDSESTKPDEKFDNAEVEPPGTVDQKSVHTDVSKYDHDRGAQQHRPSDNQQSSRRENRHPRTGQEHQRFDRQQGDRPSGRWQEGQNDREGGKREDPKDVNKHVADHETLKDSAVSVKSSVGSVPADGEVPLNNHRNLLEKDAQHSDIQHRPGNSVPDKRPRSSGFYRQRNAVDGEHHNSFRDQREGHRKDAAARPRNTGDRPRSGDVGKGRGISESDSVPHHDTDAGQPEEGVGNENFRLPVVERDAVKKAQPDQNGSKNEPGTRPQRGCKDLDHRSDRFYSSYDSQRGSQPQRNSADSRHRYRTGQDSGNYSDGHRTERPGRGTGNTENRGGTMQPKEDRASNDAGGSRGTGYYGRGWHNRKQAPRLHIGNHQGQSDQSENTPLTTPTPPAAPNHPPGFLVLRGPPVSLSVGSSEPTTS